MSVAAAVTALTADSPGKSAHFLLYYSHRRLEGWREKSAAKKRKKKSAPQSFSQAAPSVLLVGEMGHRDTEPATDRSVLSISLDKSKFIVLKIKFQIFIAKYNIKHQNILNCVKKCSLN